MPTRKHTITVPIDLMDELFKYRAFINISAVCTEALRAELERLRKVDQELAGASGGDPSASVLQHIATKLGER